MELHGQMFLLLRNESWRENLVELHGQMFLLLRNESWRENLVEFMDRYSYCSGMKAEEKI